MAYATECLTFSRNATPGRSINNGRIATINVTPIYRERQARAVNPATHMRSARFPSVRKSSVLTKASVTNRMNGPSENAQAATLVNGMDSVIARHAHKTRNRD